MAALVTSTASTQTENVRGPIPCHQRMDVGTATFSASLVRDDFEREGGAVLCAKRCIETPAVRRPSRIPLA